MRPLRYAGGRRADGFKPFEELDDLDKLHIARGEKLIKVWDDAPDLRDTPERWEALWSFYEEELLAAHIGRYPGSRPAAWYRFSCDRSAEPAEGESEPEFLDRTGQLSAEELEAIRRKALELVGYNGHYRTDEEYEAFKDRRPGIRRGWNVMRRPEVPADSFIPPSDLHAFAARRGLLTAEERAVLGLDAEGRSVFPRPGRGPERREKPPENPEFPGRFPVKYSVKT